MSLKPLNIVEYSEKSIAVIGDTKPFKDDLKALGGKWNSNLSCGPGWIFGTKSRDAVSDFIQNIGSSKAETKSGSAEEEYFVVDTDNEASVSRKSLLRPSSSPPKSSPIRHSNRTHEMLFKDFVKFMANKLEVNHMSPMNIKHLFEDFAEQINLDSDPYCENELNIPNAEIMFFRFITLNKVTFTEYEKIDKKKFIELALCYNYFTEKTED